MQMSRLFEIVYFLIERKTSTAKELAEHFEVSPRTILRDIDALSAAGIPIYASQGRGGGIAMLESYVLNKALLSREEQRNILFALRGLSSTGHIETESVIRKLKGLFVNPEPGWIEVDFSRWGSRKEDKTKFECLKSAVINRQALGFTYSNARGQTAQRKVYPLKLVFKSTAWYLQAYCLHHADYRTYKISRIRDVERLDEFFDDQALRAPELEPHAREELPLIALTLLFSPHAAYRVCDEFDEQAVAKNDDGSFLVKALLPDDYWLCDYILSFGSHVEVLEPRHVREEMARLAEAILQKHTGKT